MDHFDETLMFPSRLRSLLGNEPKQEVQNFGVKGEQKDISKKNNEGQNLLKLDPIEILDPIKMTATADYSDRI